MTKKKRSKFGFRKVKDARSVNPSDPQTLSKLCTISAVNFVLWLLKRWFPLRLYQLGRLFAIPIRLPKLPKKLPLWVLVILGLIMVMVMWRLFFVPQPITHSSYSMFRSLPEPVASERFELEEREVVTWGYFLGQCTDYASRMADTPQNWGDAWEWPANAEKAGWEVSRTPSVGAIAQVDNHVALIERISGSGIFVSEMNYDGNWNVVTTRWTSAENWDNFISNDN